MPTYDYKCLECGHIEEHYHSMTKDPTYKCPKCGAKLKKQIGGGGEILFKGSGFHQTDYPSTP